MAPTPNPRAQSTGPQKGVQQGAGAAGTAIKGDTQGTNIQGNTNITVNQGNQVQAGIRAGQSAGTIYDGTSIKGNTDIPIGQGNQIQTGIGQDIDASQDLGSIGAPHDPCPVDPGKVGAPQEKPCPK
jgi:enhancing lycopene biosynthesis protein 2